MLVVYTDKQDIKDTEEQHKIHLDGSVEKKKSTKKTIYLSTAQRIRQQVLPSTLKAAVASYLAPKTPQRILDRALAYAHQRLTSHQPGVGWVYFRALPGIEIEVVERTAVHTAPHYHLKIHLNVFSRLLHLTTTEATRSEILPLTEASVLQILYVIRSILTRFELIPTPEIEPCQAGGDAALRRVTMLRALDVIRPSPATQKTLEFIRLFRP